eukprot:Colp12_sorted_trinity150504_noHs@14232
MKGEVDENRKKCKQAQSNVEAWQFTPDSTTGMNLMTKCRTLLNENKELGVLLSQGKVAALENELALQRKYNEELKASRAELEDIIRELTEEMTGMESQIYNLRRELNKATRKGEK